MTQQITEGSRVRIKVDAISEIPQARGKLGTLLEYKKTDRGDLALLRLDMPVDGFFHFYWLVEVPALEPLL